MRGVRALAAVLAALAAAACAAPGPMPPAAPGGALVPGSSAAGSAQPPPPAGTPSQPARQFRLGAAASALVAQAHAQAGAGEYAAAGATLERALRIEPDNPLLWVELGRVQLGEGNAPQADGMGRKALALATGDPSAQASAWRLIADSLHARGRTADALEAEQRAATLAPQ
ncbi:MAG TPA: tetratricopeptide repeat protein [Steroidobacteraceae bacterium]|nr:tetratricopeptide repeat protein [Steroidobacteraceae bacterium]